MKFTSIEFIIILSLVKSSVLFNSDYLLKVIVTVNKFIKSQEYLMFYCADCRDERIDRFVARLYREAGIPQYVTNNYTKYKLRNVSKRNYYAIVFAHSIHDPIFKVHDWTLRGWHFYLGMVVLLDPVDDMGDVNALLIHLYRKHFTYTNVYFACSNLTDNIYGFRTYPKFEVENHAKMLTSLKEFGKRKAEGVAGYAFYTPLRADVPRVFKFLNHSGQIEVQGTSYRIFRTFTKYQKGVIREYPFNTTTNTVNMREILQLIKDEKIDISVHAYALYNKSGIDQSYPLLIVRWCIMVPSFNEITSYLYPIKPFEWKVWMLYFIATLSFIATYYWWERLFMEKSSFVGITLIGLCLMLNTTAPRRFNNPSKLEFFLLGVVLFSTAVVTLFYTSFLGSILTVNLFRQQINNINDLIDAKIPVMMIDYEYDFLRQVTTLTLEFEQLIYPVDPDTYTKNRNSMNTTYAYLTTDDRWHFVALQQRYLKQPKFRLSDICFGSFHMGFPMQIDSPIWRDLEYFIYRIHSSGLYHYYESIAYDYAVQGGYAQRLTTMEEYKSAGMGHLLMAFQVLIALWGASLVCFVCELLM